MSDKYRHMEEAWGIEGNPFPSEAIHQGSEPYNPQVFPDEYEQFFQKLVYGALMDRRGFSFLWSKGANGEDTGFGKTSLLKHAAREVNKDFGETVLRDAGMKEEKVRTNLAVAAYASLNTLSVAGIYPILFAAAEYLSDPKHGIDGRSTLDHLRERIIEKNGLECDDDDGLKAAIKAARRGLGATLVALREDALEALVSNEDGGFANYLSEVSDASRIRSGLSYFDFVFTIASAAGVPHFCVFVDQLEDLATTPTVTKAKRTREVGRLRDIIAETAPFAGKVRFVFTFHIRASFALDEMWRLNRLPSYDPEDPANAGSLVVLRGVQNIDQARKLLTTYLSSKRADGETDNLTPFDENTLPVLIERSSGRPGILLQQAHKLYDRAADQGLPRIDREFAKSILGSGRPGTRQDVGPVPDPIDAREIDDLLK
jgi:hypothetical protein